MTSQGSVLPGDGYVATQIRCPFCNAAAARRPGDDYTCEFCLQPFSVHQAESEDRRLKGDTDQWLEQKIGAGAGASSVADASSRSYIFQQRILPDLKRDVDRAFERLGAFGHLPLVPIPLSRARSAQMDGRNPLLDLRPDVLALKTLRSRLESERVTTFAMESADRAAIETLDRRVADVLHLSNLADAARRMDALGYASARRNLDVLLNELNAADASGKGPAATIEFRAMLRARYQALAELCRICEEVVTPNPIAGGPLADRLEEVARQLIVVADALERSEYSPVESMPMVLAVKEEAASARLLGRWLHSYDALCASGVTAFGVFAEATSPLLTGIGSSEDAADMLDACAQVVQATRGRAALRSDVDFSWVPAIAEKGRQRKSLGMFGIEEQIAGTDEFMVPVWLVEVTYSQAAGTFFKGGVEQRRMAIVSAIDATGDKVVLLPEGASFGTSTEIRNRRVVLPTASAANASPAAVRAAGSREGVLNARGRVIGLGLVPGVIIRYSGKGAAREVPLCLADSIALPTDIRARLDAATRLLTILS
jgi:hypothetical protein